MANSAMDPGLPTVCSGCGSNGLHTRRVSSAGAYGPSLLRGLGGFLNNARFDVVVCARCGLTQFFAEPSARNQLPHRDWEPLGGGDA